MAQGGLSLNIVAYKIREKAVVGEDCSFPTNVVTAPRLATAMESVGDTSGEMYASLENNT